MIDHENCRIVRDHCIGKTIGSVGMEQGCWNSPEGVTIGFTDGSSITFTADMVQGVGHLVVLEEDK